MVVCESAPWEGTLVRDHRYRNPTRVCRSGGNLSEDDIATIQSMVVERAEAKKNHDFGAVLVLVGGRRKAKRRRRSSHSSQCAQLIATEMY
jgi:hypothetical protein